MTGIFKICSDLELLLFVLIADAENNNPTLFYMYVCIIASLEEHVPIIVKAPIFLFCHSYTKSSSSVDDL